MIATITQNTVRLSRFTRRILHGIWCRVLCAACLVPCRVRGAGCLVPCWVLCVRWRNVQNAEGGGMRGLAAHGDCKFRDQITESARSAPANLAEGFGCYRHPEFARYVRIARASLLEAHNHLGDGGAA